MAEKGYGDFAIRMSLEALGIPDEAADKALKRVSVELSEAERIALLRSKRSGLGKDKMMRYLAGRGFPYEKIVNAIGGDDQ
jgi:SOS response regulatory protein OraA/RecX